MHRKGVSHIDFAIAMSVMIIAIAFSIFYVTSYFSRASPADKTSELQSAAVGIGKILFDSAGIPQNWENNNYTPVRVGLRANLKRIAITAAEKGGVNHSFEETDLHVIFDNSCLNTTYNNSIRVYDRFMNETNFRIYNYTECAANSGFLREANINFLFNITGNSSQIFWLYYTNNTATPKKSAYNFSYDSSLAGYWKFDSANLTNYTPDSSGYGNDGKLYNGSTSCFNLTGCINLTAGQINSALSFDGVNDYVDAGSAASLKSSVKDDFSVSAWIKANPMANGFPDNKYIVSNWNGADGNPGWLLSQQGFTGSTLRIQILFYNGTDYGSQTIYDTGSTDYTKFHKVDLTRNKNTGLTQVYFDAALVINETFQAGKSYANVQNVIIGSKNGVISYFNGTIDEVRIYNRSLSADEIKALYNYTRPNYIVSSGSVPAVMDKKISALQNLSYADVKSSLDLKKNFNITACDYGFGRHIPDTVNVISSTYPVMIINSSGSVKPCLASVNVW